MAMAKVYGLDGSVVGEVSLPAVFAEPLRMETIKRAVLAQQSARRQRYGADVLAGKRTSAHYEGKRRRRFTMMNREMSRMPRIHGKGVMPGLNFTGRFAPHAVKGRRAHPPKAEKIFEKKINSKERTAAIRSALAATANSELVKKRHAVENSPMIVVDEFESLAHTKEVRKLLAKIADKELERSSERKVRAGRGKMRGRKYRKKRGPLVIASANCPVITAARNIAGVDAITVRNLNAELLAPGAHPGRFAIISKKALGEMTKKFGEMNGR